LGRVGEIRKIMWIKWDTICLKKDQGGLGGRKMHEFNLALLIKWWWRMWWRERERERVYGIDC